MKRKRYWIEVIGWAERGDNGERIEREQRREITDSIEQGSDAEEMRESEGYKIRERVGDRFIEFTNGELIASSK